jgi:hypothetical protein
VGKLHRLARIAAPALLFGVLGAGATATPAEALTVNHVRTSFTLDETIEADSLCAFDVELTGVSSVHVEDFRDAKGDFVKVIFHFSNTVTLSANGQSLTQTARYNQFDVGFDGGGAPSQIITAGLFFHVRLPNHQGVVIEAGRNIYDLNAEEGVFQAGNIFTSGDNAALCAALS